MRPSREAHYAQMARLVSTRSTCLRRHVGCVLVDAAGRVLATGYNGVARGQPHCNEHDPFHETGYPHACASAFAESGERLDECEALHAEQNALLQCRDADAIAVAYVTTFPCVSCVKLLLGTECSLIVFCEPYAPTIQTAAVDLWTRAGRGITLHEAAPCSIVG